MSYREVPCSKCGGTGRMPCSWCHGEGGWTEVSGGEKTWTKCGYCDGGKVACDNGCVHGYVRVEA